VPEEPTSEVEITEFGISPNYPNPFNPLTKINFQLPIDGQVKIVVYDIMGREVEKLVDQKLSKGKHTFTWDASGVASGMYFCRYFVTDNVGKVVYNEVKKMLLMR
jgi:flagellar hook assembly protein FlgD